MGHIKVITFTVGESCFALPSGQVKEIIDHDEGVKRISYGGRALRGILSYYGDLTSVLNTPALLEMAEEVQTPLILICREKGETRAAGLTITAVKGIEFVDEGRIKPAHAGDAPYITGFIRERSDGEQRVTALVSLRHLLDYAVKRVRKIDSLAG